MADRTLDTATDTVRDAFYVGVGAGVLAFQKLQVRRVELTKALSAQLDEARGNASGSLSTAKGSLDSVTDLVDDRVKDLEGRLNGVEERLETVLVQLEGKLPGQARDLVRSARDLVVRAA